MYGAGTRSFRPAADGPAHPVVPFSDASSDEVSSDPRLREANEQLVVAALRQQELAEEARRQSAQMDALLASLHEGVVVIDRAGRILLLNPAAREIFGLPDSDTTPPDSLQRHLDLLDLSGAPLGPDEWPGSRALRGERFSDSEHLLMRAGAAPRRITFSGSAIRNDAAEVVRAVLVCRDVTELRELERQQEEYVALISHDLRNPLAAILVTADHLQMMLTAKGLEAEAARAQLLIRGAKQMSSMIQELLESTLLETGAMELHRVPTDLVRLVTDLTVQLSPNEDRVRVEVESPEASAPVCVDPQRLERAVANLISNALKYSAAPAPVVLRVERTGNEAILSVIDQGVGIPVRELPFLFDRFYRVQKATSVQGLGLGLYIARQIVEAHGGRIWAESAEGHGSTLRIALPLG